MRSSRRWCPSSTRWLSTCIRRPKDKACIWLTDRTRRQGFVTAEVIVEHGAARPGHHGADGLPAGDRHVQSVPMDPPAMRGRRRGPARQSRDDRQSRLTRPRSRGCGRRWMSRSTGRRATVHGTAWSCFESRPPARPAPARSPSVWSDTFRRTIDDGSWIIEEGRSRVQTIINHQSSIIHGRGRSPSWSCSWSSSSPRSHGVGQRAVQGLSLRRPAGGFGSWSRIRRSWTCSISSATTWTRPPACRSRSATGSRRRSTLLIGQADGVVCYRFEDGRTVRTLLDGQGNPRRTRSACGGPGMP